MVGSDLLVNTSTDGYHLTARSRQWLLAAGST
jgi:hypothetical protein